MASFCVRTADFQYNEEFYEQTEGMTMGSPLSPALANLYMEWFEETALLTAEKTQGCGNDMQMTHSQNNHMVQMT